MTVHILSGALPTLVLFYSRKGFYTLFPHYIPILSYACMETLIVGVYFGSIITWLWVRIKCSRGTRRTDGSVFGSLRHKVRWSWTPIVLWTVMV